MESYALSFQKKLCSYSCSHGPNDRRGQDEVKRKYSFVKKRGCECHFIIKIMVQILEVEIISYNMYEHVDSQGSPCHGQHDTSGLVRVLHQPNLSRDMVSYVESCFSLDVPVDFVCKMHVKKYIDMDAAARDRDFFLCRKDVVNIYNCLIKGNYQFHKKDEMSVNLWYRKHPIDFFFYQNPNGGDVPFIVGIQMKWILETMVRLSNNSLIAMDSTFNMNEYGVSVLRMIDLVQ